MKKNKVIIALIAAVVFSLCFNFVAYGGETPIIPISGDTTGTGDTGDESGGNWELPPVDITTVDISKCTFSKITNKVYSGNAFKPAPKVTYKGTTLKKDTDYTLKWANNKNVGTATITVTGKGTYKGSKKITFKINPKGTSLSSVSTPKKKLLKVTWKKQATQTTGYQIQYATNDKFGKAKTVTVTSNKTTQKTISKLTSKKKYFVRVRTYKTVNGTKYCSSWSAVKNIKVK